MLIRKNSDLKNRQGFSSILDGYTNPYGAVKNVTIPGDSEASTAGTSFWTSAANSITNIAAWGKNLQGIVSGTPAASSSGGPAYSTTPSYIIPIALSGAALLLFMVMSKKSRR